jgi:hypothetical protein
VIAMEPASTAVAEMSTFLSMIPPVPQGH